MFRPATYSTALIILLAVYAADTMAQSGRNTKVLTWQSPANTSDIYVGILGEVAHPGVYHLDQKSLTLQSVIRRAGGLTDGASLTIRLVRGERVTQNIFFNPHTEGSLLPGDLLIVESKRSQAAVSKLVEGDPRLQAVSAYGTEHNGRQERPIGIQLALLNVLDRPVFVPVKHEEANLLNIVQKLGQSPNLAQSVRVISPERLLSQGVFQAVNEPIPDGSVLVFPRDLINRNKLPSLPPVFESGIAIGAMPSLIGGRSGQSPELRNVGQLPPLMAHQTPDVTSPIQPESVNEQARLPIPLPSPPIPVSTPTNTIIPAAPLIPPPSAPQFELPQHAPSQTPMLSSSPRIANVPFSGPPPIKKSSTITSSDSEAVSAEPRADRLGKVELGKHAATESRDSRSTQKSPSDDSAIENSVDDLTDESTTDTTTKSSSITLTSLLGVVACVALLIGAAIATRRIVEARGFSKSPDVAVDQRERQFDSSRANANVTDSSDWSLSDVSSSPGPIEHSSPTRQELTSESDSIHDPEPPAAESFSALAPSEEATSPIAEFPQSSSQPIVGRQVLSSDPATEASDLRQPIRDEKGGTAPRTLAEEAAMSALGSSKPVTRDEARDSRMPLAGQSALASRLDQLIRNELPIREERVEFPRQIVLQGRIVPPPVFRVDPKVSEPLGHGPHFEPMPAPVEEIETKVIIVPEANVITDEVDGSHKGGPSKPHFMKRRAGEKTVAATAAATAKSNSPPTQQLKASPLSKSSSTPLTDALRQLQGGQS